MKSKAEAYYEKALEKNRAKKARQAAKKNAGSGWTPTARSAAASAAGSASGSGAGGAGGGGGGGGTGGNAAAGGGVAKPRIPDDEMNVLRGLQADPLKKKTCVFFNSTRGCNMGANCRYEHVCLVCPARHPRFGNH